MCPAIGALLGAGCGAETEDGPFHVLDPCVATVVVPAPDATSEERAGIQAALVLWEAVGGPATVLRADAPETAGLQLLPVTFQRAAPSFFGLYRPAHADILINRGLVDPGARAITVAHEIGHAFGLSHIRGQRSLMNPGNLRVPPAAEEARLISEHRGPCPAP